VGLDVDSDFVIHLIFCGWDAVAGSLIVAIFDAGPNITEQTLAHN
jgi:flagellar biosynthesis protein FliQ